MGNNKYEQGAHKLWVVIPAYHWSSTTFWGSVLKLKYWRDVVGIGVAKGVYTPKAMEYLLAEALEDKDWNRLVTLETDNIPPDFGLRRAALHTQDIVGSMYFRHEPPHEAVCYVIGEDDEFHALTPQSVDEWSKKPALYRCGSVGFGFTSIARRVFENWDKSIPMFRVDDRFQSHDLWFCYWANKQGFEVYVDTQLQLHHLTELPINIYHNQACKDMVKDQPVITVKL